jgi:ribosomal-protein-alanine N-acetyltransferase
MTAILETERLLLRRWRDADRMPFRAINADPRVMEFFPVLMTAEETDQAIARIERHFDEHGFGLYATEVRATGAMIGFVGISIPGFDAPFMPAVEIGWRLAFDTWGRGFATEGARAVAEHAFRSLGIGDLVSFTVPANVRSRRVMEKIGMTRDEDGDFEHPKIPEGHPLRRHVLYRLHAEGRRHEDLSSRGLEGRD